MLEKPITWMLILFTALAAFTTRAILTNQDKLFEQSKDFPEILHLIDLAYVDDVDMKELLPHAFQGALEALDPNASFVPVGAVTTNFDTIVFERTGMALCRQDGYAFVLACAAGSPAAKAGLERGVYIKQINNQKLRKISYQGFQQILGTAEGHITLYLAGSGENKDKKISFQPEPFQPPKLEFHAYLDGLYHLQLPVFYDGFEKDLTARLKEIPAADTRILLDLRNNALGNERDLHRLAGLFLKTGKMASWVVANQAPTPIANTTAGPYADRKLFILINSGTARAAECFAAAAREQGGVLVGFQTMGLGFDYQVLPLSSGAHVIIPYRKFVLPSGSVLARKGLDPDLVINNLDKDAGDDPMLIKALELIRKTPQAQAG